MEKPEATQLEKKIKKNPFSRKDWKYCFNDMFYSHPKSNLRFVKYTKGAINSLNCNLMKTLSENVNGI